MSWAQQWEVTMATHKTSRRRALESPFQFTPYLVLVSLGTKNAFPAHIPNGHRTHMVWWVPGSSDGQDDTTPPASTQISQWPQVLMHFLSELWTLMRWVELKGKANLCTISNANVNRHLMNKFSTKSSNLQREGSGQHFEFKHLSPFSFEKSNFAKKKKKLKKHKCWFLWVVPVNHLIPEIARCPYEIWISTRTFKSFASSTSVTLLITNALKLFFQFFLLAGHNPPGQPQIAMEPREKHVRLFTARMPFFSFFFFFFFFFLFYFILFFSRE